jgi:Ca2+-binding RTX toxin-like protein
MSGRCFGAGVGRRRRGLIGLVAALAIAALPATDAFAQAQPPGLPLGYSYKQVDSPNPIPGGAFGWGVASGDFTGDGENDLLVPQSQPQQNGTAFRLTPESSPVYSKVFIIDGVTGQQVDAYPNTPGMDAIEQLETYSNPDFDPVLGFVYVERMPDVGSCPGGDGTDDAKICDAASIGAPDGVPEILIGGRNAQVPPGTGNPTFGRGYVIDGATRAVIKRIDMPPADRTLELGIPQTGGQQFGRVMTSLQGLPPCAGSVAEANNMGVGLCPNQTNIDGDDNPDTDPVFPQTVRIGDVNGGGVGDIVVTARNFRESLPTNETQTITVRATAGTYRLSFNATQSNPIAFNADTATLDAEIEAIIGAADVTVTGGPGNASGSSPYTVTFTNPTLTDQPQLVATNIDLTGGTVSPAVTTATVRNGTSVNSAQTGSQCASVTTASTLTCTGGRAWIYPGESFNEGDSTSTILETPLYTVKNPFSQTTGSTEFGGNMWRIGDISNPPDGRPDLVIASRNTDYPLENPTPATTLPDVGASFLFSGSNGAFIRTDLHPEPQPRATYSGSFNSGVPAGDLGLSLLPDYVMPAPLQNNVFVDDGTAYTLRGDAASGGGGGQGSWNFAQMDDPNPIVGGAFGSSTTGVGDLVGGADAPANEMLIGGWGQFDPGTEAVANTVGDVHIVNTQTSTNLQTIPDPTGERGAGFGVGLAPMGDLNDDGFLDFAVTAYLSNGSGLVGAGRVYIFSSDNTPPPTAADALALASGRCANMREGTDGDDSLQGTEKGDTLFALRGNDTVSGLGEDDCLDGGDGTDVVNGGDGADTMRGRAGHDRLIGGVGADRLFGEAGKDKLAGGKGKDFLVGGKGKDKFKVKGGGADRVNCGKGKDVVIASAKDKIAANCERVKA